MTESIFIKTALAQASSSVLNIWRGTSGGGCNITGPCNFCDALVVVRNIITLLLEIAIPLAVAMMVWGAISLAIAAGNEQRIASGRKTITAGVWGTIIALCAWLIVNTLLQILSGNLSFPWAEIRCG